MAAFFPDTNSALVNANKGFVPAQKAIVANFLKYLSRNGVVISESDYTFEDVIADIEAGAFDADVS